jgi:ketosteroid isomerase-like protein
MPLSPNAQLVTRIFDEVAKGNGAPFWEAASDDMVWRAIGTGSWAGVYRGKQAIIDDLFRPLNRVLATRATIPTRIIDGGEFVVVQARGKNTTRDGQAYDNDYCFVIRFQDGKMVEYEEYMDTELAERVLGPRTSS